VTDCHFIVFVLFIFILDLDRLDELMASVLDYYLTCLEFDPSHYHKNGTKFLQGCT
jgi:hypothetical protein